MLNRRGATGILFDTGEGGSGGGSGGADSLGAQEAIRLRHELRELQGKYDSVTKELGKLEADHGKLTKQFDKASGELSTYTAADARKSHLSKVLESSDYKGKINVDSDKVMRYLNRGSYDETKLDSEIREAVDLFAEKVEPKGSTLDARGAGDDRVKRDNSASKIDPIGAAAAGI